MPVQNATVGSAQGVGAAQGANGAQNDEFQNNATSAVFNMLFKMIMEAVQKAE